MRARPPSSKGPLKDTHTLTRNTKERRASFRLYRSAPDAEKRGALFGPAKRHRDASFSLTVRAAPAPKPKWAPVAPRSRLQFESKIHFARLLVCVCVCVFFTHLCVFTRVECEPAFPFWPLVILATLMAPFSSSTEWPSAGIRASLCVSFRLLGGGPRPAREGRANWRRNWRQSAACPFCCWLALCWLSAQVEKRTGRAAARLQFIAIQFIAFELNSVQFISSLAIHQRPVRG